MSDTPERRQELADLTAVMSTPQGRRVMKRILDRAGVNQTVLAILPGFTASESALANGARQNFGHFLLSEILDASGESYATMLNEDRQARLMGGKNG